MPRKILENKWNGALTEFSNELFNLSREWRRVTLSNAFLPRVLKIAVSPRYEKRKRNVTKRKDVSDSDAHRERE